MKIALAALALAGGAFASSSSSSSVIGCTAEDACIGTSTPRCLSSSQPGALPCTLDYQFNETGTCACGTESCSPTPGSNTTSKLQLLVVGDSISMGYVSSMTSALSADWEVVHAPGNNDNANWGSMCIEGWLGADPLRWDAVTINHGLHDLAFPDNEHLSVANYEAFLGKIFATLQAKLKPSANVTWMATTPVPTNPAPACVLIPGRLESNVLLYNAAAAGVVLSTTTVGHCDLHRVITNACGVGYSNCSIAQCAGPHFSEPGFGLLGAAAASCVVAAAGGPASVYYGPPA
jgi:hypothetical protein